MSERGRKTETEIEKDRDKKCVHSLKQSAKAVRDRHRKKERKKLIGNKWRNKEVKWNLNL
jgi:hypothetical protein